MKGQSSRIVAPSAVVVAFILAMFGCGGDPRVPGPTEPEVGTGVATGGPMTTSGYGTVSPVCHVSKSYVVVADHPAQCIEINGWNGPVNVVPEGPFSPVNFQCFGWGPLSLGQNPWYILPNLNTRLGDGSYVHPITTTGVPFATTYVSDPSHYQIAVVPRHPTTRGPVTISCTVDHATTSFPLTITGPAPILTSIDAITGLGWISRTEQTSLSVATYSDNYHFTNAMNPDPAFGWRSLDPTIASVSSSGVVTGLTNGIARIEAYNGSLIRDYPVTIGCLLGTSPEGSVSLMTIGSAVATSAVIQCPGGASPPPGTWTWTTTGPIRVDYDNSQHSQVHLTSTGAGAATARVCTAAGIDQSCSAPIAIGIFGTTVRSSSDGITQDPGANATGSFFYTVKNVSPVDGTASIACSGSGPVLCTGLSLTSLVLPAYSDGVVKVSWATGSTPGGGYLTVTATGGGVDATIPFVVHGGADSVAITSGPTSVRPGARCEWMGTATGGTPPYSWNWTVDGSPIPSSDLDVYFANTIGKSGTFVLGVTLTDAAGVQATDSRTISVGIGAPACLL